MPAGYETLAPALASALGCRVSPRPEAAVGGGCINECFRWDTADGPVFVKIAPQERAWNLESERDGLERLAAPEIIRVPGVRAAGSAEGLAFLALEWLDLRPAGREADERLGVALARLHAVTGPAFGLPRDNAIGATPQRNTPTSDWPAFWSDHRLGAQLSLAARNGYGGRLQDRGQRLLECVDGFFAGHSPQASLLHGDLWAGNRASLAGAVPVIFDPAVYYGDAEADVAMTHLFGGFSAGFDAAYASERPPAPGADVRRDLYNLYHVMNHLNLFGGGYRAQAEAMIDRLLAAAGR
jgi:fructosamine-3-kinase